MIRHMQMYWLLKLDDIFNASLPLFILAIFVFVVCSIGTVIYKDDDDYKGQYKGFKTIRNISVCFVLLFGSIGVFLPSTKQMATIYVVPAIVNNERVQNIGNKTLDISEDLLKLTEQYLQAVSIDKR